MGYLGVLTIFDTKEPALRVLLTTHGYPPTISGVTLVVQRLARALVSRGHAVTVLAASDKYAAYEAYDQGVRVVRLASHRNPYWPANPVPTTTLDDLLEIVRREGPDLVHAHDALPFCLQLVRGRTRLGIPLVATCHYFPSFVAEYLASSEMGHDLAENAAWRYSIALYNRIPDVVFATATHRDRFVRHGLQTRTHIISNGTDLARYNREVQPMNVTERYSLHGGGRILAVGRLAKDKDLDVLIRALPHVPAARLLIVGEGPHEGALREFAQREGVANRVHFLGFVPEDELPGLYRACDVFAISSNHEVQSLPALQAAATGLPIVAADRGSLAEVCIDGENGILVRGDSAEEWGEALVRALEPQAASQMGLAGMQLAARHDLAKTFDAYESLYARVTNSTHPVPQRDVAATLAT